MLYGYMEPLEQAVLGEPLPEPVCRGAEETGRDAARGASAARLCRVKGG